MKPTSSSDKDRKWHDLVQRARADAPPAIDLDALLASLPPPKAARAADWGVEFNLFLGQRAWAAGALAACGVFASVWLWNDAVENDLPWIELVNSTAPAEVEEAS